ncbi:Heme NO binding protein [Stieleria bergensis]|uniref:Heme NO binding protein n=1 Tax=Stieleria bergensis TaxID=2528025 RepID=A0A517T1J7_9BACT|nr:Heme NO binding protein [Planctomycetes bacterium SV_7m_r]
MHLGSSGDFPGIVIPYLKDHQRLITKASSFSTLLLLMVLLGMHGSICVIVKKFVDTRFGGQTWQQLLDGAGCPDLVLSPIEIYPDEAVMAILESACEHLGIEVATALYEIGRFAAAELVGFSRGMLHPDWKTFELLSNLESMIHRTVQINNEGAHPASIHAFELTPDKMQVVYASR